MVTVNICVDIFARPCAAAAAGTSAPGPQQQGLGRLHRAAARGHLAWLRRWSWWIEIWGIDRRDRENRTPLHLACANGHTEVATFLVRHCCQLDAADSFGRTPLMMAVQFQHQACAGFLLKCGADPNLRDVVGNTALHLAVLSCSPEVVELLLDHNASLDAKNKEGFTPLSLAVSEGQVETAEFLLRMGADVHARDQQQRTPLMMAASVGKMKLIQVLLHYGADISHEDTNGLTADEYACIYGYPSFREQLSESAAPKKAEAAHAGVEDFSKGGLKRSEKKGIGSGWRASAEQLDFTPKEKAPEQHGKQEKKEAAVELKPAIAGCMKKYLLNGSPDEPNTTCSENPGEHSGSTFHVSSPAKKRGLKEATENSEVQKALAQLQSESHLFHQLLEDVQEQQLMQGSAVTVSQEWFNDIFHKLRAVAEKQVYTLEEMNKELKANCTDLREQVFNYEADEVKREGNVRELQQELGEALKKLSVAEASLEVATRRCRNLEEANLGLEKELEEAKSKGNVRELQQELGEALKKLSVAEASLEVATRRCRNLEEANLGLEKELEEAKSKGNVRELQQELGEALKKLSVAEASLEVATRRCRNLEEANLGLEKELEEAKSKVHEVVPEFQNQLQHPQRWDDVWRSRTVR
ncbi:ankyrin repeat domain-containing protein 26-like [Calypte anna]|uniref:ankyrin repeat domain-containing protein 26-like n=1 Tax=Calypte anna TaxID=9244 RepID=UPI0011C38D6D|nr:ankyrin repeat domain-containing protein 26-like [Calypte anna]